MRIFHGHFDLEEHRCCSNTALQMINTITQTRKMSTIPLVMLLGQLAMTLFTPMVPILLALTNLLMQHNWVVSCWPLAVLVVSVLLRTFLPFEPMASIITQRLVCIWKCCMITCAKMLSLNHICPMDVRIMIVMT